MMFLGLFNNKNPDFFFGVAEKTSSLLTLIKEWGWAYCFETSLKTPKNFQNEKKRLISQKSAEKTSSEMIW